MENTNAEQIKVIIQELLGMSSISTALKKLNVKKKTKKTECAQGSKFDKVNNIYCLIQDILK